MPVIAAAAPPPPPPVPSYPRQPETRDDYHLDRNIGLKTSIARSIDSGDDQQPKQIGKMPAPAVVAEPKKETKGNFAKLIIQRGRSVGKEFTLADDEIYIGRWDADGGIFPDIDLDSDDPEAKVSRRHARITRRDGQFYIEDLGSTNGTFINRGRRLLPGDRQAINDGDEIIIGKTFMRFLTPR